jgi:putative FmdB family regulatory protein
MPRYQFRCPKCHALVTLTRSVAERNAPAICPMAVCAAVLERLPAAPAFTLKGPGFYKTDYDTGERVAVEE